MSAGARRPRVLLTRSREGNARWARALALQGVDTVALPCLQTVVHPTASEDAREPAGRADVWAFASPRAVELVAAWPLAPAPDVRLVAVGRATAEALRTYLGRVDLVAAAGTAASLVSDLLVVEPRPGCVLWLGARGGETTALRALRAAGIEAVEIEVYATEVALPGDEARIDLATFDVDVVFLASPSALAALSSAAEIPPGLALVTMGPTTSAAVRRRGLVVFAESERRDALGLLEAWRGAAGRVEA